MSTPRFAAAGGLAAVVVAGACGLQTSGISVGSGATGPGGGAASSSTASAPSATGGGRTTVSGSGGAPECKPGSTKACYDGPSATEGVGLCKGGVATCAPDGTYGPCAGEAIPVPEDCLSSEDQDCDGTVSTCTGAGLAAWRFGGPQDDYGEGLAIGPDGSVVVVGQFHGSVAFGAQMLTSADGATDAFVAKWDAAGNPLWALRLGGPGDDYARSVAVDAKGDVFVAGGFQQRIDFDPMTTVLSDGSWNGFAARFDPDGHFVWGLGFGGPNDQMASAVAVDGAGDAYVAGTFRGTLDVGGGNAIQTPGDEDGFLMKVDPTGKPLWLRAVKDTAGQDQLLYAVATDGAGGAVIVGEGNGNVDFGLGPVVSAGGRNVLVARYGNDGSPDWGETFGDDADQHGYAVAVDGANDVLVTGTFSGSLAFGGLPAVKAKGQSDLFVAKLNGAGMPAWSKSWGGSATVAGATIAADAFGDVALGGFFTGAFDFFSDTSKALPCAGGDDAFVAKLDPNGMPVWSRGYGDGANEATTNVATWHSSAVPSAHPEGAVAVVGWFGQAVDLGKGPMTTAGGADVFVGWLAP